MKKKIIFVCLISFVTLLQATGRQNDEGIKFETALSWKQILARAKAVNKYIFVDCHTTWCKPCMEMEMNVYPQESVGKFFNDKFISVKVQMDISKKDDDRVRAWYTVAQWIKEKYKVSSFPTYLFFTPDGKLLNVGVGAKDADKIIAMARETIDPNNDYYALYRDFENGKRDLAQMSFMAGQALLLGDTAASQKVADAYVNAVRKDSLLTKTNIQFMYRFTQTTKDRGFRLFYQHVDSINNLMGDDIYSQQFIQSIIFREMVKPELEMADKLKTTPDWNKLLAAIRKKYNEYYAGRVITSARSEWAYSQDNMAEYTRYLTEFIEAYGSKSNRGMMPSFLLNNYAWEIFQYSNDKGELMKALKWSCRAVTMYPNPNWMDTYANLSYKLGRKEAAIMWEKLVVKLEPKNPEYLSNLEKMEKGEPTWHVTDPMQVRK